MYAYRSNIYREQYEEKSEVLNAVLNNYKHWIFRSELTSMQVKLCITR